MDCNNKKGRRRIVDPVRRDPRAYLEFDLTTGEPLVVARTKARPIAEATRSVLHNQTLNEARRVARSRMVEILVDLAAGKRGARAKALRALDRQAPHRAIVRDLILEQDIVLNPHRATVNAALAVLPSLAAWALVPP